MDKLNEALRTKAIELGLCKEWQNDWREDWNTDKLISKFYDGIDFCLSRNYPTNDFIKDNFDRNTLLKNYILVDEKHSILNAPQAAVFGKSKIKARYNGRSFGRIYIKDDALINVVAHNSSTVLVHVLDSAVVHAECYDRASVVVIRHSEKCLICGKGSVVIKDELNLFQNP